MAQAGAVELVEDELFDGFGSQPGQECRVSGAGADFLVDGQGQGLEQGWLAYQNQIVRAREVLAEQAKFAQTIGGHEMSVVNDGNEHFAGPVDAEGLLDEHKLGIGFPFGYVVIILMSDVTLILQAVGRGEKDAPEELLPIVYEELRRLAAARMAHESAGHTLQPTALVHEVWLRMVRDDHRTWKNRAYFFAAAAEAMRRILVEHARRKSALKHGGGLERLNIDDLELAGATTDEKLLLVDEALEELAAAHSERAHIVVMKYFGGMTNQEVAETLGISSRTVNRHWLCAQAWLFERIQAQL